MTKRIKRLAASMLLIMMLVSLLINTAISASAAVTLCWPVPGHRNITQYLHKNAIDIADSGIYGADVVAAMSGTVTHIFKCTENHYPNLSSCNGFGTGVVISGDDGRTYSYAHMMAYSIPSNVYVGTYVSKGQKIGQVGNTGNSNGSHLHFAISPTGNYWDPSTKCPSTENYDYSGAVSTPSVLTISGVNYPINKKTGSPFEVFGVISSPNVIINGEAIVYDSNGNQKFGIGTYEEHGRTTFNLNDFDAYMYFSSLPAGQYVYVVSAIDEKGYSASVRKEFTVNSSATSSATAATVTGKHDCERMGTFGVGTVTKKATCTETGTKTYTCTECKNVKTEAIAAIGSHSWSEWTVTKEPTYSSDGEETRSCVVCDKTEARTVTSSGNPFFDVLDGKWYTESILWCYNNGYMAGISDNTFGYKETVTRAMFATLLAKVDGGSIPSYSTMSFSDVAPGRWYSDSIEWVYRNGYASGIGGGIYGYKDSVTREQLALFLYTYSQKKGYNVSYHADISGYADILSVHYWALDAMEWAVGSDLISGTSEKNLSPRESATRAEVALIIKNYVETVVEK